MAANANGTGAADAGGAAASLPPVMTDKPPALITVTSPAGGTHAAGAAMVVAPGSGSGLKHTATAAGASGAHGTGVGSPTGVPVTPLPSYHSTSLPPLASQLPPSALPSPGAVVTNLPAGAAAQVANGLAATAAGDNLETRGAAPSMLHIHNTTGGGAAAPVTHQPSISGQPLVVHYNAATNPALLMQPIAGQPPLPLGPPPLPSLNGFPNAHPPATNTPNSANLQLPNTLASIPTSNSSPSLSALLGSKEAATGSAPTATATAAAAAPAAPTSTLPSGVNVYTRLEPCINRLRDVLKKVEDPPTYISQILLNMEQFTEYLYNKSPPAVTASIGGTPTAPTRTVASGGGGTQPIRDTDHLFQFNGFDPRITAALLQQVQQQEQAMAAAGGGGGGGGGGSGSSSGSGAGAKPLGKHMFETSEMWKVPETEPIYDIGISFSAKESSLPEGWELLKKSMNGSPADLNKGSGARPAYLIFKRGPDRPAAAAAGSAANGATNGHKAAAAAAAPSATAAPATSTNSTAAATSAAAAASSDAKAAAAAAQAAVDAAEREAMLGEALKPITSLSVIFADTQEEAPYGFKRISHTLDKVDANLGAAGRSVFLCVFRGDGAPITDLGVVFHEKQKEALPSGFHEVKHTPFGNKADLNAGSEGTPVFICFRPYVTSIIQKFQPTTASSGSGSGSGAGGSGVGGFRDLAEEAIAKTLSLLVMCMYCYDQRIVVHALESFKLIPPPTFANCPHLLNTFLQCVCDATPCFLTYFATQTHTYLLNRFLLLVYGSYLPLLTDTTVLKIFEACFLARHEDKDAGVSQSMLQILLNNNDRCKPCRCQKKKDKAAAAAAGKKDKLSKKDVCALRCHKCQWRRAVDKAPTSSVFAGAILQQTIDAVACGSALEAELGAFLRTPNAHKKLRTQIHALVDAMYGLERSRVPDEKKSKKAGAASVSEQHERLLMSLVLMCCKFATETAPYKFSQELSKSETVKRKLHALTLLLNVIQKAGNWFRATPGGAFLLRRVICPALVTSCVTDVPSIFRLNITIFLELWQHHNEDLMIELGVFLDQIFLGLLESSHPTQEQKKDILELFVRVLPTPASLANLYYNYDNHNAHRTLPVYERLVASIARIVEGDFKTQNDDAALDPLKRHALKVLVHVMRHLADWIGVPLHGPNAAASAVAYVGKDAKTPPPTAGSGGTAAATGPVGSATAPTGDRRLSWQVRLDKQRQRGKLLAHCLRIGKESSIKKMVQHMALACPELKHPQELAKLLYYGNENLNKTEVGDYLSSGDEKKKSEKTDPTTVDPSKRYFEHLRNNFIALIDFTGMTFDAAIRLYLCDSGFKLPGEAQRIDRMMATFVRGYLHDNPGVFRNADSGYIVAFAVIMLNTELHNPNLKNGSAGKNRQPMTKDQFIKNLKGVDDGRDFPRQYLSQIYDDVAANPIEWKDDIVVAGSGKPGAAGARAAGGAGGSADPKLLDVVAREKVMRHAFEVMARKAQAYLRVQAPHTQAARYCEQRSIGGAMFECTWNRFYTSLSMISDRTKDVDLLRICLDGLAYGSTVAIQLGAEQERLAFTRQLAKITFIERNRNAEMVDSNTVSAELQRRLVKSDHLKQDWYTTLAADCAAHPLQACKLVLDTSYDVKQRIIYDRRQSFLRRINGEFGGELNLVDPARMFVRESLLTKMSNASRKPQDYHFFLFNDLLLYASEGLNTKYVMHRVVHLSLCRLVDYQRPPHEAKFDAFAFRIVSPQKSFLVCAKNAKEKQKWLDSIATCIRQIQSQRRKIFGLPDGGGGGGGGGAAATAAAGTGGGGDATATAAAGTAAAGGGAAPGDDNYDKANGGKEKDAEKSDPVFDPAVEPEGRNSAAAKALQPSASAMDLKRPPTAAAAPAPSSSSMGGIPVGGGVVSGAAAPGTYCKLCIRSFGLLRGKHECSWCRDKICSDCCKNKCALPHDPLGKPGTKRTVCDACWGDLSGMLKGDIVQVQPWTSAGGSA